MVKSGFNAVGADGPAAAIGNVFQATTSFAEFWMATVTLANLRSGIREARSRGCPHLPTGRLDCHVR